MLWITDPWSTLDYFKDTTLRLMSEALQMGIPTYWSASDFILNSPLQRLCVVRVTTEFIKNTSMSSKFSYEEIDPSKFHQIHYRVDPPVDQNYISLVENILAKGVKESRFFNPPQIITKTSEKIPPKNLKHLAPRFEVVSQFSDLTRAFTTFEKDVELVSKPLNLAQSIGVKKWQMPASLAEFEILVTKETQGFKEAILFEEYLSEISLGEVRIWYCFGTVVAALKKHPKAGDFRVLIDEGSKVEAYTLNDSELKIALEVGTELKRDRVALAAIDFISNKICDYNITSPGLLVQLEQVHGRNFARRILELLLTDQMT